MVRNGNKKYYSCKYCGDMVNLKTADEVMKDMEICNKCANKLLEGIASEKCS